MASPSKLEFGNYNLNLLSAVGAISDKDIAELRKKLKPELVEAFDQKPEHQKIVLAALSKRGCSELAELAITEQRFVGVHDVRNEAKFLLQGVDRPKEEADEVE